MTYGLAVTGLAVKGTAGETSLTVSLTYEPCIRHGETAIAVQSSNVTVRGLAPAKKYTIYRYVLRKLQCRCQISPKLLLKLQTECGIAPGK